MAATRVLDTYVVALPEISVRRQTHEPERPRGFDQTSEVLSVRTIVYNNDLKRYANCVRPQLFQAVPGQVCFVEIENNNGDFRVVTIVAWIYVTELSDHLYHRCLLEPVDPYY